MGGFRNTPLRIRKNQMHSNELHSGSHALAATHFDRQAFITRRYTAFARRDVWMTVSFLERLAIHCAYLFVDGGLVQQDAMHLPAGAMVNTPLTREWRSRDLVSPR